MTKEPVLLRRADWASDVQHWRGRIEGEQIGTGVTVLFFSSDTVGDGPPLHWHTYDELFIIRQGRALFTVGEKRFEAVAGDIVFGPAHVPHKFENLGPGLLETTDIHLSERFFQTVVEEEAPAD